MASIRKVIKNGKVSWQATVSYGRDASGKQIRDWVTRDTEKECKTAARKLEQDFEEGKINNYSNMKFEMWANKFIDLKRPPELSPTTHIFYTKCIKYHLVPFFKRFKLGQINDIHIREYIAAKRKETYGTKNMHYSEVTIKKHLAILSHMLGMALKKNNPCIGIDIPSGKYNLKYVPTLEEFERLLNAVVGLWDEIPILLAGWCGMREGEIFCIKVNDVLPDDKIRVDENRALAEVDNADENYNGPAYQYVDKGPKSENGFRIVSVPEYVIQLIKNRIAELGLKGDDYIFNMRPDSYGKRFVKIIRYHNMMLLEKPKGRKASFNKDTLPMLLKIQDKPLPEFTFHALRHYHATFLYEHNFPDQYAAQRLGHDIAVLKRIYQRLRLKEKSMLDDKIKEIFKKPEY
jgi:integrase